MWPRAIAHMSWSSCQYTRGAKADSRPSGMSVLIEVPLCPLSAA
jgi:hypothetical protein